MIHARSLENIKRCPSSYYYQDRVGIKTVKDKNYYLSLGIKAAIKEWKYSEQDINDAMPNHPFLDIEKSEEVSLLSKNLERYFNFLGNRRPDKVNVTQDINVNGKLITVSADMIFATGNVVEVVRVKRSAPKLSFKARSESSMPSKNLDLFLLQLMGEHLYPGKTVVAAYHHLTSKGDKGGNRSSFDEKPGHNVIKYTFQDAVERRDMFNVLEETLRIADNIEDHLSDKGVCHTCSFNALCSEQRERVKLNRVRKTKKADEDVVLTKSQRKAITFTKGGLRINAGAGSGKTTVIALRVVELIMDGCNPKDILTITFTNKGAREMEEKIEYWLEREGIPYNKGDITVTTFNAWGDKVLNDNFQSLGFAEKPRIIEKVEKYDILMEVLQNNPKLEGYDYRNPLMDYKYSKGVLPSLTLVFDFIKSQIVQNPDILVGKVKEGMEEVVFDLFTQYQELLTKKSLIDYQDQIRMVLRLMDEHSEAFDHENYKHLIVDEYQDTDEQQFEMLMFLTGQPKFESIMVVGDDAQSIYGFRNTSKENLMEFHKKYGEVTDINLEDNFRSTPEIVALANSINDLNTKKIEKKLISGRKKSKILPRAILFDSEEDEYEFIADDIAELVSKKHIKNSEIAVIARTKFELFELEKLLLKRNVPYVIDIPEPLINHPKVKMAEHLLVFLEDEETTQGIFEYLTMSGKLNDKTVAEIQDEIESQKALVKSLTDEQRLAAFYEMIDSVSDEVIEVFFTGLKSKDLSFSEMLSYLRKFVKYEDKKSIEKSGEKYNAVTLTTAHTSKGKEFDTVYVLTGKYNPINNAVDTVEEERRTFYVSITRAKKHLYLTANADTDTSIFFKEAVRTNKVIFDKKVSKSA